MARILYLEKASLNFWRFDFLQTVQVFFSLFVNDTRHIMMRRKSLKRKKKTKEFFSFFFCLC